MSTLKQLGILRYRGVRGGSNKQRKIFTIHQSERSTFTNRKCFGARYSTTWRSRVPDTSLRPRCLVSVALEGPCNTGRVTPHNSAIPGLYIINARSIAKPHAKDQLLAELNGYKLDFAIVTETHLKKHHPPALLGIEGFHMFRRDRERRRAGGVAVMVSKALAASEFTIDNDNRTLELLWVKVVLQTRNAYIGALYHPPSPVYEVMELLLRLEQSVDSINNLDPTALIILGGDFNRLGVADVIECTGLIPLITQPTRGENILDRLFVSEPCYGSIKILTSAIKTDHRAIIATTEGGIISMNKKNVRITIRRRTPQQNASLLRHLESVDLSYIAAIDDLQNAWNSFYLESKTILDQIYPLRRITMTSSDPPFLTPEAKLLLRRKNRLMRAGRLEEASAMARRVGLLIERTNRAHLRNIDLTGGLRGLWRQVNDTTKGRSRNNFDGLFSADDLNEHYARTSIDPDYSPPSLKLTTPTDHPFMTEYEMFSILDRLHHTADGIDGLPAWFLRLAAPVYSAPLCVLINRSMRASYVPHQWTTAIIHPVAKVQIPVQMSDFRPISITPVISRVLEREIVHRHLYPTFVKPPMSQLLSDQFAFRPTGSTTSALIAILHELSTMLRENSYVTLISLDFSRAFDTVRHSTLAAKLSELDIHDHVYNWIVNFLSCRQHVTRFEGRTSKAAAINSSVVQGSGLGPSVYDINASDLHPMNPENRMFKYADDTYLLVGSRARTTVSEELANVSRWASRNNLRLNTTKSREMIIARRSCNELPPPIDDVVRVQSMHILGVTLGSDLGVTGHVDEIVEACSGSLHALRILRAHGLPPGALQVVTEATTLSKLLYAAPAWWGFASAADRHRLERFLARTVRTGYLPSGTATIEARVSSAEDRLLQSIVLNEAHVLHRFFPPPKPRHYALRPRAHDFVLPLKDEKNFIARVLYKGIFNSIA
jgi:Reverse transcriptase (RNA-dependent DNA polymerase)/Endonuclease/Exonuclease/phosphatase family